MDEILSLVSINGERNGGSISTFDFTTYPFRIDDGPLPEYNTVFLYTLMSIKQPSFVYIGLITCIKTRIINHNSGNGSSITNPLIIRPFAVIAFICGFDGNKILHCSIEHQ